MRMSPRLRQAAASLTLQVQAQPLDRAARRRAHRLERKQTGTYGGDCKQGRCSHKQRDRKPVVVVAPGRMTAAERRDRNARRLNARQLVGVVSHLKHLGMTAEEIQAFLKSGGRA